MFWGEDYNYSHLLDEKTEKGRIGNFLKDEKLLC